MSPTVNKKLSKRPLETIKKVDAVKHAQDIITIVREPFLVLDSSLHVVTANPAFYKTFKVLKKNTEGILVYKLGNGQWNIPELRRLLEDVLPEKKDTKDYKVMHNFPSIGQKVMLLHARQIDSVQFILLSIEDVTEVHKLEASKVKSEEHFRALIEKSTDAIALVTVKGKVIYASPATERLMGYTSEEFKKLTNPFELVPPDDRKFVTKLFEKLLRNQGSTENAVYRVLHKNGRQIWIESAMTNLLDDPNVKAIVINYRDVTERKNLETQKIDFISIATHELKTPVTSIKGYAQVMQSRFKKEGNIKAVEMLSKMDAQLKKLTVLIGDLLDVTQVDGGKLQFHVGFFDFNELVSDITNEMELTTTKHYITKKITATKVINGDRDRIGQVITNLISNAIKYSPHNEKIVIATSVNKTSVTLCVQDFGIGISKEKQAKIFERFFRAGDSDDTFGGLGLGLFISSEIIKRHGGKIWVESTKGKGSSFCFTLPIKHSTRLNQQTNTLVEEEKHE